MSHVIRDEDGQPRCACGFHSSVGEIVRHIVCQPTRRLVREPRPGRVWDYRPPARSRFFVPHPSERRAS